MKKIFLYSFPLFLTALIFFTIGAVFISLNSDNTITPENIANAEKILGINFSESQRDSMVSMLNERLSSYKSIGKIHLDNSIPPAILFNPIPEGFISPKGKSSFKISSCSGTKLPKDINELAYYTVGQLGYLIKTKQITSLKLTKFFIHRLKKYGPGLHCLITLTEELALKEAKETDKEISEGKYRSPLMGIPYGVKDLLSTRGYKTTWGAGPFKEQMIDEDAAVIKRLKDAGAILVAKLSMGALAMGDVWYGGKTRNPWDTTQGSSGSSAGPAAAVSAGLIPFAIGSETWGSIVSPSTRCGDTGLRPTYGRVSRTGAMTLSWSMDKLGPIARDVEDCAIVFNYIYGPDGVDQTLYNYPYKYSPKIDLRGMRIGYLAHEFSGKYSFKKNDSLTIETLKKLGAVLIPVKLPNLPVNDISFILDAECSAAFDELTRSRRDSLLVRQTKGAWPNIFRASHFIPAFEYVNANRIRYLLIQEMEKMFDDNKIDVYLAPSFEGDNSLVTNLSGHPLVVVPNGFNDGIHPTSITFVGRLFDEGKILAIAKKYQDATGYQLKHPPMFK